MTTEKHFPFSQFLLDRMADRKRANRRYSLRAFARDLQISPGRLSDILKGKCLPGSKLCTRMVEKLKLTNGDVQLFFALLEKQKAVSPLESPKKVFQLRDDEFAMIADWEHYAILSLLETDDFQSDDMWIANRLGVSLEQARAAVQRLFRLNLMAVKDGRYVPVHANTTTSNEVPSTALRESHRQILNQAIDSLFKDDVSVRDITSVTFAMNDEMLPKAKQEIRKFRMRMMRLFNSTVKSKTEVYNLNVQLCPVTRRDH